MEMTKNQLKELEVLDFFVPSNVKWGETTEEDKKHFFDWSERGVKLDINTHSDKGGLSRLYWAKSRRDMQYKEWKKDLGVIFFLSELERELPRVVYDSFLKTL